MPGLRAVTVAILAIGSATSLAGQVSQKQIEASLGLLPPGARDGAEVILVTEDGLEVVRPGENGWACRIRPAADRLAASCYQTALTGKLDLELALAAEETPGEEVREALGAALRVGRLSIPRGSFEISGSGPLEDGAEVPAEMSGYYFVYFPFETGDGLGLPETDPGDGTPWLHHGGTSDAHIMWPRAHSTAGL
ncbi:MAG TPA: hypothetical protein VK837_08580 [Longimicrobiales bacterium]|nr:hypothetical protein [Longimicrobiales bacterium]